jgi:hypothetical protein
VIASKQAMIKPATMNTISSLRRDAAAGRMPRALKQPPSADRAAGPKSGLAASLTGEEKQMIESQFPSTERMSLRLYGPARPATQATEALGSRIDLKG